MIRLKRILIIMGLFSSLFGCGKESSTDGDAQAPSPDEAHFLTAQLNHPLMPLDRGERYEDPLYDVLIAEELGETTGGGTMQAKSGEIDFIDVEITLTDLDRGVPLVISKLEELGAPKGSMLHIYDSESETAPPKKIPFGKVEGLAIYLDGVTLPAEVYENSDINVVVAELNKAIAEHGEMQSSWQGETETAMYFYGDDAGKMAELMKDFLDVVEDQIDRPDRQRPDLEEP